MTSSSAALNGIIALSDLPPHAGLILSLAFFEVPGPDTPPPYDGDPPASAVIDELEILREVDLDRLSEDAQREIPFSLSHEHGHFYLQLRAILFRAHDGSYLAQAEQFFFGKRPLPLFTDIPSITLPVQWPSIPVEDLHPHGTVGPTSE